MIVLIGLSAVVSACASPTYPLATLPVGNPEAAQFNLRGIALYNQGKWEEARQLFAKAIKADPALAEAHFNLALTLHQLGRHDEATEHFRQAGQLAPEDPAIVKSTLYRNHLGLSSTLERHWTGGYRYP